MDFVTIVAWAVLICQPTPTEACRIAMAECLLAELTMRESDAAFEQCAELYAPEVWE